MESKPKVKFEKTKAHQRYKKRDGTVVPGATTVLGVMDKGGALLRWAWQCGIDGKDYLKERDQAANIGTLAHWMCECHLLGLEPDTSEFPKSDIDKAENSFLKFLDWWEKNKMQRLVCLNQYGEEKTNEVELVSELGYGGTLDLPCRDRDGRKVLCDLKTCRSIHTKEQFSQLSSYDNLYTESQNSKDGKFERWIILRIGKKEAGDFEVREMTENQRQNHWVVFERCLGLHQALKRID